MRCPVEDLPSEGQAQGWVRFTLLKRPPAANNLYANTRRGRVKSVEYRLWLKKEGLNVNLQRVANRDDLRHGAVSCVALLVKPGDPPRREDVDGRLKAAMDLLVRCSVISDDSREQVASVYAEWRGDLTTGEAAVFLSMGG